MPCGGIYPCGEVFSSHKDRKTINDLLDPTQGGCWVCGRGGTKHFCDEWDTFIHARCAIDFLKTEEGECIISHGHTIELDFSLEEARK